MRNRDQLGNIYRILLESYGSRNWWPAKTRLEVIVGAILAQNVSWSNAKKAVNNLIKSGLLNPEKINASKKEHIASKIISSRFYNQKAEKLKTFCRYLMTQHEGSLNKMFSLEMNILRKDLLALSGIGEETADCILLYAGKKLSFVSDAYTKRFLERYGLIKPGSKYGEIRQLFMDNIPEDYKIYNEYHALIVHHCYEICKSNPLCNKCPFQQKRKNIVCKMRV